MSDDDVSDDVSDAEAVEFAGPEFDDRFEGDEPGVEPGDEAARAQQPADESRWELPEPTGVAAVDDALAPLVELADLPTAEHVVYYETVHRRLQDALADLDSA